MGRSTRNFKRMNFICPTYLLLLIIPTIWGAHNHLDSNYEQERSNTSRILSPTHGRRATWSEVKILPVSNQKDYFLSLTRDNSKSGLSYSQRSDIHTTKTLSPRTSASSSLLGLARRNSLQVNNTYGHQNLARIKQQSYAVENEKFYDNSVRKIETEQPKLKLNKSFNQRTRSSKASDIEESRRNDGSFTNSRKLKHKYSSGGGQSSIDSGKATNEKKKGRSRNYESRNSNYHKSTADKSSSMARRTVNSPDYFFSFSSLSSPSSDHYTLKSRSQDNRRRSYRRHLLDRSYFLPSFEDLSESEDSMKETEANLRDEYNVPSIQQIPKPSAFKKKRPNIILFMTDDLDVELGSLNYMPHLLRLMADGGALFPNAYTTTPVCCPSRSSMLTGMYIHNHQVFTNHHNCSSTLWQNTHERRSFASYLSKAGYKTGYFGKYLNRYKGTHVPPGWKEWAGLVMNSRYYNYTINRNNNLVKYGNRYPYDYYPHVITNDGIRFLRGRKGDENSFMLVLSYPAPHGPEDSAPEHAHKFFNASDHHTASYNYAPNPDKQWMLQFTDRMPSIQLKYTDLLMTKRLQTLQTIDDALEKIVSAVEEIGETENTYLFFTSDHGYHLGQFGLAKGKSMPFEFDVKVPFFVRGPGIKPGVDLPQIALNIDLAPTFLDIAGLPRPPQMDGRSLLPILQSSSAPADAERLQWRDSFLLESSGRLREEEELEKKEQRTWKRERALSKTLLKATSTFDDENGSQELNVGGERSNTVNLYASKHQRLEVVCQRMEFATPCKRTQKWHCVKIGSRWKIKKCRRDMSLLWRKHCICHFTQGFGTFKKLDVKERRKQKNFLKKYVTTDLNSFGGKFIKYFNNVKIPLHFSPTVLHDHSRWTKKRGRRNRYRRSIAEHQPNTSAEFPSSFDLENYTNNFELYPVGKMFSFENANEENVHNITEGSPLLTNGENESVEEDPQVSVEGNKQSENYPALTLETQRTDDLVHHFVEEEELRDIKDQIYEIKDEIHSLENVGSTSDPVSAVDTSSFPDGLKHRCQATDGQIDCQKEVYSNFSAWRNSKVEIEDQIRRLSQQLNVMENILQHLQTKKPDYYSLYEADNYDDFEDNEKPDDFYEGYSGEKLATADALLPEEIENESLDERENLFHSSKSSIPLENGDLANKQLTLPEVGLEIPLVEDVPFGGRNRKQKLNGKKQNNYSRRKNRKRFEDIEYDDEDFIGKLYYPVTLPTSDDDISGNESSPNRLCWCERRVLKKIAAQEARERKRKERQKFKEKKIRKQRKKIKSKSEDCNYASLNCYTHDNDHWKTPPLWTDGEFCFCLNSANNTFWCLRTINETHNFLYCEFITGLITYYDLHIDPYQLRNVAFTLSSERVVELNEKLRNLRSCKGADECDGWAKREKEKSPNKLKESSTDLTSKLSDYSRLDYIDNPNLESLSRKKLKRLRERQRKKKLRKERKNKKLKFDDYAIDWPEASLAPLNVFRETVRIPRKSRHSKAGRKQKRREKRRRKKRRKERRLLRMRYKKKISSASTEF